jgi:hypothetical protein
MSEQRKEATPSLDLSTFAHESLRVRDGEVSSGIIGRDPMTGDFVHQESGLAARGVGSISSFFGGVGAGEKKRTATG